MLLAFGAGGKPGVVMSIVFAGAPIVNAVVAIYLNPPEGGLAAIKWQFYLGIVLAATGGCLVTFFKPPPARPTRPLPPRNRPRSNLAAKLMAGDFPNRQAIAAHQLAQLRQLLAAILPAQRVLPK